MKQRISAVAIEARAIGRSMVEKFASGDAASDHDASRSLLEGNATKGCVQRQCRTGIAIAQRAK